MANAKDFLKALQSGRDGVATVDDAWDRQKIAWLEDLTLLRTSIRDWLAPISNEHLAKVSDAEFQLMEPDLGSYAAPGLTVELVVGGQPQSVVVRPRGMRISGVVATGGARAIGARGRVDIECGVSREILLRFKDNGPTKWLSFYDGEKKELDEEVFFELLARTTALKLR